MKKKVTLRELVGARIVLAVCIAVYYWCWARNDWHSYYTLITNTVAAFVILFFVYLSARERKYKKEVADELAVANLRRCDSICLAIAKDGSDRVHAHGAACWYVRGQDDPVLPDGCERSIAWRW